MSLSPPTLPTNPQCTAPIPVPTYGPGGIFTVACSTTITAPALTCLQKVLDLPSYGKWNTFIPRATLVTPGPTPSPLSTTIAPGAKIRFEAVMVPGGSARTVELEVTFLETFEDEGRKGYRVVWKGLGFPGFLLRSERVQEFIEEVGEDGTVRTRYGCWETFGGVLAYLVPRGQLEDGFGRWMSGLKGVVEEEVKGTA